MKALTLASLLAIGLVAVVTPVFAVDPTCIPPATGVPGNATPPHWWDNTPPQSAYATTLDDPRWVGAGAITYGDGANTQAEFRALYAGTDLYLSWRVYLAPATFANQNHLYLGLPRPAGNPMIIDVSLPTLAPNPDFGPALNVQELQPNGHLGVTISTPTWLSDTARVWINNPTANSFAVEMRVPTSAIAISGNTFLMWYELVAGAPDPTSPGHVFNFNWPNNATGEITKPQFVGDTDHYPLTTVWQPFHLSTGPGDASCAGGVSLDVYQIGAHHPGAPPTTPDSEVLYALSGPAPVNTMFARPRNDTGGQINTGDLRATFSLANWGSMIGDETAASWTPIPIVGCVDCADGKVGNSGPISNGMPADGTNEIHFDWQLGPADYAPYENGTRNRDNCMLVTLSSRTGLRFVNNSIRRNMDFEHASTMTRTAEISIKGLAPIAPDGRDVYLYIETLNLPERVNQGEPGTTPQMNMSVATQPGTGEQPTPVELDEMAASGKLTDAQMDQWLPTYRVHVFHDTGNSITAAGVQHGVLRPQGGFGYRVVHQGTLLGWVHKTICLDCTMTEIAPNFYKISKVPNNGIVHVRTTIQALEPGSVSSHHYRWFLDVGPNFPHGTFSNGTDGKLSVNTGFEKLLSGNNSVELIAGYHLFDVAYLSSPHIWQLSFGAKHYFGSSPMHPFLNAAAGVYRFDPGNTTKAGANAGFGVLYDLSSVWGIEGVYNYHWVNTSGSAVKFSTLQIGIRRTF